jgi:hypothetical protein
MKKINVDSKVSENYKPQAPLLTEQKSKKKEKRETLKKASKKDQQFVDDFFSVLLVD